MLVWLMKLDREGFCNMGFPESFCVELHGQAGGLEVGQQRGGSDFGILKTFN